MLYTVGHGTRSVGDLAAILADAGVGRLVDVRRHPGSRRNPHLSQASLSVELPARSVTYEWWGEELGGRRSISAESRHPAWRDPAFQGYADHMDSAEFREALSRLLSSTVAGPPVAVMCAETLWWKCHRRLIADAATVRGSTVVHLLGLGKRDLHPSNPSMRVGEDGWPVYDIGIDRPFNMP